MREKERYANAGTWEAYFSEEEGIEISAATIQKKLEAAGVVGITARNMSGRLLIKRFFSESDVRRECRDLLVPLPQADEANLIHLEGEIYTTIGHFSSEFGVASMLIEKKIEEHSIGSIRGKTFAGRIRTFYPQSQIQLALKDYLALPRADENGFIELDGQRYGTLARLRQLLNLSESAILDRLKGRTATSVQGRSFKGRVRNFYSESELREICQDILSDHYPQANDDGVIIYHGRMYLNMSGLGDRLGISTYSIGIRIGKSKPAAIQGRDRARRLAVYYSESDVREICQDLLQDLPHADKTGLIIHEGRRYLLLSALRQLLGLSWNAIRPRIKKHSPSSIRGKDGSGQVRVFYLESEVQEICGDLLKNLPQADESGLLSYEGERYGTLSSLRLLFGLSQEALQLRIKRHSPTTIQGKTNMGQIRPFYLESEMCELCADLITKKSKK